MAILCLLAIWAFYFWLVQKLVVRSLDGGQRPRAEIPDTVPPEWIEAYRSENDA